MLNLKSFCKKIFMFPVPFFRDSIGSIQNVRISVRSGFKSFLYDPDKRVLRFSVFCGAIYFVQATGTTGGLAGQAIQFFLKEGLGLTATTMAYIFSVASLAWWIKPGFGLLSDFVPLWGYRRRSYIYLCNAFSIMLWISLAGMAFAGVITTFWPIAIVSFIMAFCFGMTDVVADGLMVQTGKATENTGRFQAIQWGTIRVAIMATTVLGAVLALWAMPDTGKETFQITQSILNKVGLIFLLAAFFPSINIMTTYFLTEEEKMKLDSAKVAKARKETGRALLAGKSWVLITYIFKLVASQERFKDIKDGIKRAVKMKQIWVLALCLFGLHFSPGWGQPFWYYLRDHCGSDGGQMGKMTFAWLSTFESAMGVIGCIAYWRWCKSINIRKLLYFGIILGFVTSFFYLWVRGVYSLYVLALLFGPIGAFIHLAYLDIAAKNCPNLAEGVIFASMCSIFNIATSSSSAVGGWMYGMLQPGGAWYGWGWSLTGWLTKYGVSPHMIGLRPLIIISSLFTLVTIMLIPLMNLNNKGMMQPDSKKKSVLYRIADRILRSWFFIIPFIAVALVIIYLIKGYEKIVPEKVERLVCYAARIILSVLLALATVVLNPFVRLIKFIIFGLLTVMRISIVIVTLAIIQTVKAILFGYRKFRI